MQNEKLQIVTGDKEKTEVVIREVTTVNELSVQSPLKINLEGVITAPLEFLTQRLDQADQINQKRCHVLVNREKLFIRLNICENDFYTHGSVIGTLEQHPKFKEFGINQNKNWDPVELGQFCKMNRAFFVDKSANMELVTKLKSFEADIQSKIEKKKTEKGDFADNYSGAVTSNLPGAFKLKIPLFKGLPAEEIEVEFYASVNGREVRLQLFSPGASQATEEIRDKIIDEQITAIRKLAPSIAIIEQ